MTKYCVIHIAGSQYIIKEKDEILVNKLSVEPEARVLLFADGDTVTVGTPIVDKVKVSLKVLGEEKGEKLYVQKYKAKSRYRRKIGFRPQYTRLLVEKIS